MTDITTAVAARESARQATGQFGTQDHTAPELALAVDDGRTAALAAVQRILADHPEQAAHASEFITPKILHTWMPDLAYVEYDDKLQTEQLDAYLRGDDEPLDEIDSLFREGEGYEHALSEYLRGVTGEDPSDFDEDTYEQLREWAQDLDRSDVIGPLARHNGNTLIQLPAGPDDDTFGQALQSASEVEDEQERYAAIEKVFHDTLSAAGIVLDKLNRGQVQELIDETSLDAEHQYAEQWKLRIVTYTDPEEVSMSSYGRHGATARQVTVEHPWLLLVDPWNGRSHDVMLSGHLTTTISPDRPARLDASLGYGSLDEIAGVVHSAYRTPVKIEVAE